ncbi:MAG TPA: prolyl oligopeptidase family serine peptidase [Gemmatimonadota bacterium]|nr:prolyl oligopeptidase family serine peptidase [Gemmatimonadota bacterium]
MSRFATRGTLFLIPFMTFARITSGQEAEGVVTPGVNLVVEGIPAIPDSLADRVDRYTEFRSATLHGWHPLRPQILIGTRFGETEQIHLVTQPGGARRQLTFGDERVLGGEFEPTEGDRFVLQRDVGGDEFYQLYRYDLGTGEETLLTDGVSRNTGPEWSNGGRWVVYGSTRRTGRDVDLWIVDPNDPSTDRMVVQLEGGGWSVSDWSPDDTAVAVVEYVSINESYIWLVDVASGERTLVTPKGGPEKIAYANIRFSPDGRGLYVTTDRASEFRRLVYVDLATGQHRPLTPHIDWDVEEFELSPDGSTIAFVTNEDGTSILHRVETASGRELSVPELPTGVISNLEWHPSGAWLGFSISTSQSPSDVYSLDVESGRVDRWTFSETGGLPTSGFASPELVHWETFDGRTLSGFLYSPPERFSGPRPVIVDIHGGPESQARPGFLGRDWYFVQEQGFAILYPNVRGSAGYGKTFLQLDNGTLREDAYADIETLLDWIALRPDLDAGRIAVTGGSYGGHMTFSVAARYSDRIRAAIPVVGMSSLVTFLENTQDYRRDLRRAEYGDERIPEMRAFLERIAPLGMADAITVPMLVVQGGNDPRVPLSEAEQMVARVRDHGTEVWYLMARDEGHGFARKANQDFQFYATVMFLKEKVLD